MAMLNDYMKARRIGLHDVHRDIAAGRYPYPPSLDYLTGNENIAGEFPVGLMEIPVSMITGIRDTGRQNAFSSSFMPILAENSEFAVKWQQLCDIQVTEGIRDPVRVYEFMQKFYVREGNKRVSVMKFMDMPLILADITRILPKKSDELWNRIYYEFLRFFEVCPIYGITFSEEGGYERLAELLGQSLETPWPDDLVSTVRYAFGRFEELFKSRGGDRLSLTSGDAFLIYLTIFRVDSLVEEKKDVLDKRIFRIWNEFLTESGDDRITVVESPDTIEKAGAPRPAESVISAIMKPRQYTEEHPLRAAFIYDRTAEESRWIYGHELGRNALQQNYEGIVETVKFEGRASEEEVRRAVEEAVEGGSELIITTSPAQMAETLRCAIRFPKIKFMNCSVNLSHNAVRTYYGRMYEAKFLMGALAASVAENHRIGFLADYPIYGSMANINAFAIGAAMIDPLAKLYLTWSSVKDVDWKADMREKGVSVYSGPDLIKPQEASREYGIYQTGPDGQVFNLAAPVWDWGTYYGLIVRTILNGTWNARDIARPDQALNYYFGMQSGVIDVIMSEHISYYSRKLVRTLRNGLVTGTLNPFDGELRSQEGVIKTADSPRLTNLEIIEMDWLNDNVVGSLPEMWELSDHVKETVQVSGVPKAKKES